MKKTCKEIEELLVDYADGQLSPDDSNEVAGHLAQCRNCPKVLGALQKSLDLAGVIWNDSLAETKNIRIPTSCKIKRFPLRRYAAIAASILLVVTTSIVWRALVKPEPSEITFAEIERRINESASAARLLTATELLADHPDASSIVEQQYRYIIQTYPDTIAAKEAKSRMQQKGDS